MEKTVKCPICGKPYMIYEFYAGDQSACPACRNEARKKVVKDWREYYILPESKRFTLNNRYK